MVLSFAVRASEGCESLKASSATPGAAQGHSECGLAGDLNCVEIGGYTNIQDRAVIHTTPSVEGKVAPVMKIGDFCSIGASMSSIIFVLFDYLILSSSRCSSPFSLSRCWRFAAVLHH